MNMMPPATARLKFEQEVLARLFLDLGRIDYAVLRNHEQLPFRLGARDIDVVVRPADLRQAVGIVVRLARDFGLRLADHYADERMTQLAFMKREGQEIFDLKIDFFTSSQVFGIELMSAGEMLTGLRRQNGVAIVSDVVMLLDKWLFHLVVGRPLHPKYNARFGAIAHEHGRRLQASLSPLLGRAEADRQVAVIASGAASDLPCLPRGRRIRMLAGMARRRGVAGLPLMARFLAERLRNRISPHGFLVSVSGPDGSGKTTVIDLVLEQLRQIYGADSVEYHHFRPSVLPRIAEMAMATGAAGKIDDDYSRPHRARPSGPGGSLARLGYYGLDYVLGYVHVVRPALTDRKIVLFDRYYHDMICDPGRSRIRLPDRCLRAAGRLLPLPRLAFFIKVAAKAAHLRKQELSVDQIAALNRRYGDLVRRGWMIEIGNSEAPDRAAAAIVGHILELREAAAERALKVASR
ncbi:hypothetical protein [uncultured Hoeflea sp.]|uniref:hypothetical protein n=1 Tax=uncultured Hoeflea sp. TaxID=538666 RepID=UPI0030D87DB2